MRLSPTWSNAKHTKKEKKRKEKKKEKGMKESQIKKGSHSFFKRLKGQ